jgi:hypothetical protein
VNRYVIVALNAVGNPEKTDTCNEWVNAKRIAEKFCKDLNCEVVIADVTERLIRKTQSISISDGRPSPTAA